MIKRAFLISSSAQNTTTPIVGTLKDVENFKHFLQSLKGGAWEDNEIFFKDEPNDNDMNYIRNYNGDYSLIFIASHGFYYKSEHMQYVIINEEEFPLDYFFNNAKKQLIIVDACREYHFPNLMLFAESFEGVKRLSYSNIRDIYRQRYEDYIEKCNNGRVIIYSTNINDTAGEDKNNGGIFTSSFIKVASDNSEYKLLDAKNAVILTRNYMHNILKTEQNPIIESDRRINYFPISIII
ncbi:caspase family protein [Brachyspira aalborgi]|uniref:Caspase family protein n=1 Tax=Brachyspira aalborgi TaxID=29522 RepID=A0A5C8F7E9_9SPIR|nr:caspase family protein [Brachyspira aalborgi]TXJ45628.1 caspase family protein [Brachyspira aalborgi]